MNPLQEQLLQRVRRDGALTFADFMATALYEPFHGFYAAGKARIGRGGDFTTSVSTGALFGRLLARQFAECWKLLERPTRWTLVEQGAFDGRLSCDVLEALQLQEPECFAATTLFIVEPFPRFRTLQAETLLAFEGKVQWCKQCNDLPDFSGIHFSNELLDAFPVHRIRRSASTWLEQRVGECEGVFVWQDFEIDNTALRAAAAAFPTQEEGFAPEVCLGYGDFFSQIAAKLHNGWLLACDYGMTAHELALPHRRDGTLAAYRHQQRCPDILEAPGEQDLTAHVNFTAAALCATEAGFEYVGYTDQHRFLTGLAALHFADATETPSLQHQREVLQFRTLTHPQLMGAQFKAFCLSKGVPPDVRLSGFTHSRPLSNL